MGLGLAEPDFHTRCFVEWEEYPRRSIIAAQRTGYFAPAPIWDDLTTFDAKPFAGAIDTVLAGYPCQPFSQAGKRLGADDPRHIWPHVARVIRELGDGLRWVFLENVAGHITLGAETVLRELWEMGFTPAAGAFSAAETGAPHERLRWFCVAHRAGRGFGVVRNAAQPGRGGHADGGNVDLAKPTIAGLSQRGSTRRAEAAAQSGDGMVAEPQRCGGNRHMADANMRRCEPLARDRGVCHQDIGAREPPEQSSAFGCDLANPKRNAGYQGRCRSGRNKQARGQGETDWPSPSVPPIFPPGPGDAAAWSDTLAVAPYLAPATGLADCIAWASNMAAALEGPGQAAAESHLCRMADGLALRSRALRLLGNGVHPLAAANAWRALASAHGLWAVDLEAACRVRSAGPDGNGVVT